VKAPFSAVLEPQKSLSGSPSDALEYVFKYISKPPMNLETAEDIAVYLAITRGFRRIHSFGIWYNIGKVEHHSVGCPFCGSKVSLDTDYYYKHDGPFLIAMFQMRGVPIIGTVGFHLNY
jgi:hypothetical protein